MANEERKIADFLAELSKDAEATAQYQRDPEEVLARSGLSERQKEVLRSGDLRRIREAVHGEEDDPDKPVLMMIGVRIG